MVKGPEVRATRFTIRLAPGLRAALEAAATKDRRSLSDFIVLKLEEAIGYRPPITDESLKRALRGLKKPKK
jgi:hypothetical protein